MQAAFLDSHCEVSRRAQTTLGNIANLSEDSRVGQNGMDFSPVSLDIVCFQRSAGQTQQACVVLQILKKPTLFTTLLCFTPRPL